jgi:hypothetical protein
MENRNLMLRGHAIPVHETSAEKTEYTENGRIPTDCHSILVRNCGTATMTINGEPYTQFQFYTFTPPVLNVVDRSVLDLKFVGAGTKSVWVTRSIVNFCDDK